VSKHVRGWGWSLLCLALVGAGCQERDQPPPPETESKAVVFEGTIVAVGDSLTAGLGVAQEDAYPALLERRLATAGYRYRVINAGVSGETTSGALSRTQWVLKLKPDIVILESGANDGLRGIEPQLIARNLTQMVERFAAAGATVVLAGMKMPLNLGPEYARDFAAVYPAVAADQGVILVPFFLEGVGGRRPLNQPDGIHPTAEGYRRVVDNVFPGVVEAIKAHAQMRRTAEGSRGKRM